ncbi:uncharacterized protein LA080_013738 [Diaporthe eres]|nr:uncharacterized protein LA080_013738 [Diaporthe eres]
MLGGDNGHGPAARWGFTIYLRRVKPSKAREIWEHCARDSDVAEGCWVYATVLSPAGPERYGLVLRAAVSEIPEAAREMARIEGMVVQDMASDGNDA